MITDAKDEGKQDEAGCKIKRFEFPVCGESYKGNETWQRRTIFQVLSICPVSVGSNK
jgi:hypothetical protein